MFSLFSCDETFKEIETFVEQYCINGKGIEKNIFWLILMGFRIFRILNKRLYFVYLWGGPSFFWKLGDKFFSKTNNFFSVSLSVKTFFSAVIFPADNFIHAYKKFSWAFFAFANKFFRIPPPPPPPPPPLSKSVRSSYGLQRTNLLTWIDELKP